MPRIPGFRASTVAAALALAASAVGCGILPAQPTASSASAQSRVLRTGVITASVLVDERCLAAVAPSGQLTDTPVGPMRLLQEHIRITETDRGYHPGDLPTVTIRNTSAEPVAVFVKSANIPELQQYEEFGDLSTGGALMPQVRYDGQWGDAHRYVALPGEAFDVRLDVWTPDAIARLPSDERPGAAVDRARLAFDGLMGNVKHSAVEVVGACPRAR